MSFVQRADKGRQQQMKLKQSYRGLGHEFESPNSFNPSSATGSNRIKPQLRHTHHFSSFAGSPKALPSYCVMFPAA